MNIHNVPFDLLVLIDVYSQFTHLNVRKRNRTIIWRQALISLFTNVKNNRQIWGYFNKNCCNN